MRYTERTVSRPASLMLVLVSTACGRSWIFEPPAGSSSSGPCTSTTSQTIYAHSPTELYTIDPNSWMPVDVGPFGGADSMTDLAVTPANEIYVVSESGALYQVDSATGAATPVMNAPDPGGHFFNGLTFLPDGQLLAVDVGGLVAILDPVARTVTTLGSYGMGYASAGDLVAVADGTLYAISSSSPLEADISAYNNLLVVIDPSTGTATPVGPIGFGNLFGVASYSGMLIGFTSAGQIVQIDPATGAGSLLGTSSVIYWGAGVSPLVAAGCP